MITNKQLKTEIKKETTMSLLKSGLAFELIPSTNASIAEIDSLLDQL